MNVRRLIRIFNISARATHRVFDCRMGRGVGNLTKGPLRGGEFEPEGRVSLAEYTSFIF